MRSFEMIRGADESGVSGTGLVLEGIVFTDGTCVTRWTSENSPGRSTNIWDSFGSFLAVHVSPHPNNKTEIRFSDGEVYEHTKIVETSLPKLPRTRRRRKTTPVTSDTSPQPIQMGLQHDERTITEISQSESHKT